MAYSVKLYNRVKFLLDGEEIFETLANCFEALYRVPHGTPLTYVRMAYWLIAADIRIGNIRGFGDPQSTLVSYIGKVLWAGHNVDIIVWYPNQKHRHFDSHEQVEEHSALARQVAELNVQLENLPKRAGRGRVYLERYEGLTGASQHQKFAIFSVNGQRTVVLGGLNLAKRYMDNVAHNIRIDRKYTSWHDTALKITGPVTADIEDEWMRRWRKVMDIASARIPTERLSSHLFAPDVTRQWKNAHAADIVENTTPQRLPVDTPNEPSYALPVQVAVTRYRNTTNVTDIHEEVLKRIQRARDLIYFENCQFTDPDIVRAIYQRMQAVPELQVLIVTNPNAGGVGYLTRRAWLHMALRHPSCRSVSFMLRSDAHQAGTLTRVDGVAPWRVEDNYTPGYATQHQWLETDGITIRKNSPEYRQFGPLKLKFEDIIDVDVDFHFLAPAIHEGMENGQIKFRTLCVHSKLAVIDDCLVCGSANWTYRSMHDDGEISAFVHDRSFAHGVLNRLLRHYYPRGPILAGMSAAAINAHAKSLADYILIDPHEPRFGNDLLLLPLEYQPLAFNGALSLFDAVDAAFERVPGWTFHDLIFRTKETLENIKFEAPNWRWW